jgi:hypothetical protein
VDDPAFSAPIRRTTLSLFGSLVTIFPHTTAGERVAVSDARFSARFPSLPLSVSLSRLRRTKRLLLNLSLSLNLELSTLALSYVLLDFLIFRLFDPLVLGKSDDVAPLKLTGGVCLLLAAKFSDPSVTGATSSRRVVNEICRTLSVSKSTLLSQEFPALVSLRFSLFLPLSWIVGQWRRLERELVVVADDYYSTVFLYREGIRDEFE